MLIIADGVAASAVEAHGWRIDSIKWKVDELATWENGLIGM